MNPDHYRRRIQRALEFIEHHLTQKFTAADVAEAANFSLYHFHRLFPAYVGEPVHQYVRARRLERAARLIAEASSLNVQQVALAVGFDTHSAFSRAFKQHFHLSPTQFKVDPAALAVVNKRRPFLSVTPAQVEQLPYRLERTPPLYLHCRQSHGTVGGRFFSADQVVAEFDALWQNPPPQLLAMASVFIAPPLTLDDTTAQVCYGALTHDAQQLPWAQQCHAVSAGTWAVFEHVGDYDYLHQRWNQVYRAWLEHADFQLRDAYPMERYLNKPSEPQGTAKITELWLPINAL